MKIDNFKKIESILFDKMNKTITTDTDEVVVGRIIRRRKDNPGDSRGEYIVKRYSFSTKEKFIEAQDEIKHLCRFFNARFYVSVNIKSMKEIAFDIAEILPGLLRKNQYYFVRRIFDNTADANKGMKEHRLWIFDIDDKNHTDTILKYLSDNNLKKWVVDVIPTINGSHILVKPHDTRYMTQAKIVVGEETLLLSKIVDVKKNALTLAYYEGTEEEE
jgi:hypothetical protein